MQNYDIIIIGGGTAGVIAAVQAGRANAKVLLVEKTGMLGGTITNGGVTFPGLFHAWGKQIIAGIGWELVTRCVKETEEELPDFSNYKRRHWHLQIPVDRFVYAALCDETVINAGVDVLFHSMPAVLTPTADNGWDVTLCTKEGLKQYKAEIIVDCTGDANAVSLAGYKLNKPAKTQPSTLSCRATGYDHRKLDIKAINKAYETEVKSKELKYSDISWNTETANAAHWLNSYGANASHIHGINAGDSAGKTKLELEARRSLLRLYRFLRRQPGLEDLRIENFAPECGVRETATIVGKSTVTADKYTSGYLWSDAVCYSFYPIDLHTESDTGLNCRPLQEGVIPSVPRGAMLPKGSTNIIAAGRCISSDRLANSALRVQATCMATGQAAGAMAVLASSRHQDPEQLEMQDIQRLLKEHKAIVPPNSIIETSL